MDYLDKCKVALPVDEGKRRKVYKDSLGIETTGIGRNLSNGFSEDEIQLMFRNDLLAADRAARELCPSFSSLTEDQKAALVNMAFNMGQERLSEFHKMFEAIAKGDFNKAAQEMQASLWAKQVGARAERLAKMMKGS